MEMDFPELQALEEKVIKVLEKLEVLRQENSNLVRRNEQLQLESDEKAVVIEKLQIEVQQAQSVQSDDSKEESIRKKVSDLLLKLEGF